jgi:aryl-alcohol dehydrogenase-like predicted oxidoreductase
VSDARQESQPTPAAPSPYATVAGTTHYRARFAHLHDDHFRQRYGLWLSSIGLGSYLPPTSPTPLTFMANGVQIAPTAKPGGVDEGDYTAAVQTALTLGCNVLDTAPNYRGARSEREIGAALAALIAADQLRRDEVLLCTKGGYLPSAQAGDASSDDAGSREANAFEVEIPGEIVSEISDEIAGGIHCLAPAFLRSQITRSLHNLGIETIDVYYLHNPEIQLQYVEPDEFKRRLRRAFAHLEEEAAQGRIRLYGVATWRGLRADMQDRDYLPLTLLEQLAREVAGEKHRFRFVQFPYNVLEREAFTQRNQPLPNLAPPNAPDADAPQTAKGPVFGPLLAAAMQLGLTAVVSASLAQGRAIERLPAHFGPALHEWESRAQAAIQFNRSTPGVTTALVGMGTVAHVEENMAVARRAALAREQFFRLFQRPKPSAGSTGLAPEE